MEGKGLLEREAEALARPTWRCTTGEQGTRRFAVPEASCAQPVGRRQQALVLCSSAGSRRLPNGGAQAEQWRNLGHSLAPAPPVGSFAGLPNGGAGMGLYPCRSRTARAC
jgi:hypothetical protein